MQATVQSATTVGVNGLKVAVEADVANGLPKFTIVGLADIAIQESKERVRAALRNSGFEPPNARITVNLAPGNLKKEGSAFDLPIALGVLLASGQAEGLDAARFLFLGELALDGGLRRVAGVLPMAVEARHHGLGLVVPADNVGEGTLVEGLDVRGFATFAEVVEFLRDPSARQPARPSRHVGHDVSAADLADVKGQTAARRALEIAAAGGHNLLFVGPPGSGKSMLARRMPGVLPPLSHGEALEVTAIYSVGGMLPPQWPLIAHPPFRSPHHSISPAGLVGGTSVPRPGEVSLAHRGVLFLDEMGEFTRHTLEVLRQPLEDRHVVISRARGSVTYPADFMLAAAMNPCPCGFLGDPVKICGCSKDRVDRYWHRISGPLLDRIDLNIEVPRPTVEQILGPADGESSGAVRARVLAARARQARRFRRSQILCNGQMATRHLRKHGRVDGESEAILGTAIRQLGLSARTFDRVLKVARTIADLEGSDAIRSDHVREALQYRNLDSKVRG